MHIVAQVHGAWLEHAHSVQGRSEYINYTYVNIFP